jgi:hypothetical protein
MIWSDIAQWVGPTPNHGGAITQHLYVVEHIADGTFAGTISWQKNPSANVSSHFIVAKDGRIAQMVDTDQQAWTQVQGNPYSISIENEGFSGDYLTDAQLQASATILQRCHAVYGIPLQVTGQVGVPGLGHHSMGYESGVNWGHQFCPGEHIKAQKPTIVNLAQGGTMADSTLVTNMAIRVSNLATNTTPSPTFAGSDITGEVQWDVLQLRKLDGIATDAHTAATRDIPVTIDPAALHAALVAALQDPDVLEAFSPVIVEAVKQAEREGTGV